ncbi:MAG: hypothetical protein SNJ71_07740 [Bacteroidales bacterium]
MENKKIDSKIIIQIISYTIVMLFILLGIVLITGLYFSYIDINYRIIFGSLMIAYGAFRAINLYNRNTIKKYSNDEEEEK